jgi:hypothetical protein
MYALVGLLVLTGLRKNYAVPLFAAALVGAAARRSFTHGKKADRDIS